MIALVGLEGKAEERASKLSGGQQRRLDVGMALVGDPELLFLDEPTTGFDPAARRQAWEVIAGLRDLGKTIFLTTHYMDEAQRLADRVTIIAAGEIVARGTPEDLGDRERQPATIRYRDSTGEEVSIETATPVRDASPSYRRGAGAGVELEGLEVNRPTLEDVYLELTERAADEASSLHQFRYDQKAFWRNPASVFFTVMFPVILLLSSSPSSSAARRSRSAAGSRRRTYYVPAIITLSIISATMQTLAMSLVIAREDGRLKRGRGHADAALGLHRRPGRQLDRRRADDAGPARPDRRHPLRGPFPWERLGGDPPHPGRSAPPPSAASASLLTAAIPSQDAAAPIVNAMLLPLYFLSGVFIPDDQLPSGVIHFADVFPIRHFFDAFFDAYVTGGGPAVTWGNLGIVALWGARWPARSRSATSAGPLARLSAMRLHCARPR